MKIKMPILTIEEEEWWLCYDDNDNDDDENTEEEEEREEEEDEEERRRTRGGKGRRHVKLFITNILCKNLTFCLYQYTGLRCEAL